MATTSTTSKKSTGTTAKKAPAKKTSTTTAPATKKTTTTPTKTSSVGANPVKAEATNCSMPAKCSAGKANVISPEEFYRLVAEQAYFIAEGRGFAPGNQLLDWLEAEKIVQNQLLT